MGNNMNYLHLGGLVAGLLSAGVAFAADPQASSGAPSTATAGMKVAIDPATGRIRPVTESESAQLDATTVVTATKRVRAASVSGYQIVMAQSDEDAEASTRRLASGAMAMKAPPSAVSTLVAHRDAQGRIVVAHEGDDTDGHAATREAASE